MKRPYYGDIRKVKISEVELTKIFEHLLHIYISIYGGGRQTLEKEIESLVKLGYSREEAIKELALKERLL